MNTKLVFQTVIGAAGYIAWAIMAFLDPTLRPDFLRFNIAMAVGTIGLVLRDMRASADTSPTDKQSGRALPGFLGVLGLSSLLLAGCGTAPANQTSQQAAQMTYTQACSAWNVAFSTALELRLAGKLNQAQKDQITLLDSQINPICTGPLPQDSTAATQQVTAAVTTLTILELAKTEQKK